jgi:hypothetical protein
MRPNRDTGARIGPRLVDLVSQAVLITRRELGPHEARVRAAGTQQLIDRAGREAADLYRPIIAAALDAHGDRVHPLLAEHAGRISAGTHQWESLLGNASMAFGGSLMGVINNLLAPVIYAINEADPSLVMDPQTAAQAVNAGLISFGDGVRVANMQGLITGDWEVMRDLAAQVPGAADLQDLVNRGLITEAEALYWLERAAVPAALRQAVMTARRSLLSPADLALSALRGFTSRPVATELAALTGMDAAEFGILVDNTGEPLGLMQLLEAFRRGFIDEATLERGIRESRVRDEWIPTAIALRYEPMPTADAADAALRGHLTVDQAAEIARLNGLRPEDWPAYYANQGNPPAPEQLLELWRRGFIDEADVDRGLREGRTRDEWIPAMRDLRYEPISSADAIDAWLRGHIGEEAASRLLTENGLLPRDQQIAFANAGNPLALQQLMEALRRGFIDEATFVHGFRESRYRDEWAQTALRLRYSPMSTADAVEASIQGYLSKADAKRYATDNGLDPADFDTLWLTAGEPLSRTELETLFNRGQVTRAQVEQGLRESRLKDTWIPAALDLHVRYPELRQITLLLETGSLSHDAALELVLQLGYTEQIAAAMIADAEARATGQYRRLALSQVLSMYEEKLIGQEQAEAFLEALHYSAGTVTQLLALADHTRRVKILQTGVTSLRRQYLAWRIDDAAVQADLAALAVPADAAALYLQTWQIERAGATRGLTEAQIVKAHAMGLLDDPPGDASGDVAATVRLQQLGYSAGDAALLLAGA